MNHERIRKYLVYTKNSDMFYFILLSYRSQFFLLLDHLSKQFTIRKIKKGNNFPWKTKEIKFQTECVCHTSKWIFCLIFQTPLRFSFIFFKVSEALIPTQITKHFKTCTTLKHTFLKTVYLCFDSKKRVSRCEENNQQLFVGDMTS